jgi:hypothetical protein
MERPSASELPWARINVPHQHRAKHAYLPLPPPPLPSPLHAQVNNIAAPPSHRLTFPSVVPDPDRVTRRVARSDDPAASAASSSDPSSPSEPLPPSLSLPSLLLLRRRFLGTANRQEAGTDARLTVPVQACTYIPGGADAYTLVAEPGFGMCPSNLKAPNRKYYRVSA